MGTNTSSQLRNLILITSLSSTVVSLSYETPINILPSENHTYIVQEESPDNIVNRAFNSASYLELNKSEDMEKIGAILHFSNEIISNSVDLEPIFNDLVEDNLWDLI